jgi:16S rRNA (adenine1518-N6/adenine1519-N6)-dimethyltransferase
MSPARYAQHFLTDPDAILQIIAALNLKPNDAVLEIGPGQGALTVPLIQSGAHVFSVEVDKFMVEHLREKKFNSSQFTLYHRDFLKFDFNELPARPAENPFKVAGNLPYNITSPILRKLSTWDGWEFAVIMVQKEVGRRLCAEPGSPDYGALTVGVSLSCEVKHLFDLAPGSFQPKPRVDSTVLRLTRRHKPLTDNINDTQRVIQAAFQQRRKTILNSLAHGLAIDKETVRGALAKLNIDPILRPETLEVHQFIALAKSLIIPN